MKKKLALILCLVLAACLVAGCTYLPTVGLSSLYQAAQSATSTDTATASSDSDTVTISREQYERYQQFDQLLTIMDIVAQDYYQEVDTATMIEGASAGLLDAIGDPYTFYYTPEAYAELWEDDEGEYAGIGIQISGNYLTGICTVSRVFANSPAEAAGVHKGDILYRVGEDLYVTATNLDEAVSIMRGTPGTTVDVTFLRGEDQLTFTIERATVNINRVESGMLDDQVGYIILYEFSGDCAEKFTEAVAQLAEQGAKGLIIDLRDNGGGWVQDATDIADIFLDAGVVCTAKYRDGYEYSYRTKDGKTDMALVVLVNENSASSSEILTGCLKDRADATVVGVTTYGKGIIQAVMQIDESGAGMQLTVAEYVTPNGNAIHKIGITPDVEVTLDEGDNGMHEFGDLTDAQLKRAYEVMLEKLEKE